MKILFANFNKNRSKGFTLIELLVVIGILAILLAITLIAINPARQFQQARNTQRSSDVVAILNAIGQFSVDENGRLPGDGLGPGGTDLITTSIRRISSTQANICSFLVTKYIAGLPTDPSSATGGVAITNCAGSYDTEYTVVKSAASNRITVSIDPSNVELGRYISVSR